jgi:hypothetical protein
MIVPTFFRPFHFDTIDGFVGVSFAPEAVKISVRELLGIFQREKRERKNVSIGYFKKHNFISFKKKMFLIFSECFDFISSQLARVYW